MKDIRQAIEDNGTVDLVRYSEILASAFSEDGYHIDAGDLFSSVFWHFLMAGHHQAMAETHSDEGRKVPLVIMAAEKLEWSKFLAMALDLPIPDQPEPDSWMKPSMVQSKMAVMSLLDACDAQLALSWLLPRGV